MTALIVNSDNEKNKRYELNKDVMHIGRDVEDGIKISGQGISRVHAEVFKKGDSYFIKDLNSTNGTMVNEKKIVEEMLKNGDVIQIGSVTIEVTGFSEAARKQARKPEPAIEFEATDEQDKKSSTIELKLDESLEKSSAPEKVGQEIESRDLLTLYKISKTIGIEKNSSTLLNKVLEQLVNILDAEHGYVFLRSTDSPKITGKLIPKAVIHKSGANAKVSNTIIKRTLQFSRAILTTDAGRDSRFTASESIVINKIRSVICAPLVSSGNTIGVIYLHSGRISAILTQEDLELVTSAAIQLGIAISNIRAHETARKTFINTLKILLTALEMHNPELQGHSERVANYSIAIAKELHLNENEIQNIYISALLHDIGKLAVPCSKSESPKEHEEHVYRGEKMLANMEGFSEFLPGIKYHHEKENGTGFPYKLKGGSIPLMAKIITVANAFDNLSSYTKSEMENVPLKQILLDMVKNSADEYDEKVIQAILMAYKNNSLFTTKNPFDLLW
ncbi:MAG: FHA domain-containing protein [Planctomycetes bacterium]|nr:FHA domain-containing protein [Planctomycetota bacterium]